MYLAYSALHTNENKNDGPRPTGNEPELQIRYLAYLQTCNKYSTHIAEIQKYLPGWMPEFR